MEGMLHLWEVDRIPRDAHHVAHNESLERYKGSGLDAEERGIGRYPAQR